MKLVVQLRLLIISVFLPNFSFLHGLRIFDILLFFLILIHISIRNKEFFYIKDIKLFILLIFVFIFFTLISFLNYKNISFVSFFSSGFRIFRLIEIILFLSFFRNLNENKVHGILNLFVIILSLNSILILLEFLNIDLSVIKQYWIDDYYNSVMYNSLNNNRYIGIINQPLEAGYLYSLSFLYYLNYSFLYKKSPIFLINILLLLIGGILTGSKIFILIGLPLSIIFLIYINRKNFILLIGLFSTITITIFLYFLYFTDNSFFINTIFSSLFYSDNLLNTLLGGRLLEDDLVKMTNTVVQNAPLTGFGFGSTKLMDSGFMEFFYQGGYIGLIFYLLILIILYRHKFLIKKDKNKRFYSFLFLLFILSSFGSPVLTIQYSILPFFLIFNFLI